MRTLMLTLFLYFAGFACLTTAAADDKPFVSADPAVVDDDFPFQGEYAGLILPADAGQSNVYRKVGVQVVALGNEEFDAVLMQFGLPGAGWDRSSRKRLHGTRDGDVLRLYGDQLLAEVHHNHLTLKSDVGDLLGHFPRVVRTSPTLGMQPPRHAIVLFDGTHADEFRNGKVTDDGLLMEGADFRRTFTDFTLHLEFQLAYMPNARDQKRSNSGVYMQSRYELQILDSFGRDEEFNFCGSLYRYQPPRINMCLPPLQWQTYDINFYSPRFDADEQKIQNGRVTVRHNGVCIHNCFDIERKTGAGKAESSKALPIRLQNHRDPVRFRNIWIVDHRPSGSLQPAVRLGMAD